jgi:transaldolase
LASSLQSIIASGTKLWLDSIDPDLVKASRALGATGATSNPIIVADLINSGRFDDQLKGFMDEGLDDEAVAWRLTDFLVSAAQNVFAPVWEQTRGNDGYVSFELDPLLEDAELAPAHDQRVARYLELGKQWAAGQRNRMIKVPATPAGLDAVEELAAAGVTLNVTLIFTERQYEIARDNVWRGAQRRADGLDGFKSVYSIFISRVDVYTARHLPELTDAQGMVGLANAKQIWQSNQDFWADKNLLLQQEIIFASTGAKLDGQAEDFYVAALVGSDIQTNPPKTNDAIEAGGTIYQPTIQCMPSPAALAEIDAKVNVAALEAALMSEGVAKFADPHKALIESIARKRAELADAA